MLYDQPLNEFVAGSSARPAINLVEAELEQANGNLAVSFGEHRLTVDERAARTVFRSKDYVGKQIILGVRPEGLRGRKHRVGRPGGPAHEGDRRSDGAARAEVLVYFSTEATGVVSSAAAADVGEDARSGSVAMRGDDDGKTSLCAREPSHARRDRQACRARRRHEPSLLLRPADARRGLTSPLRRLRSGQR